tara:strand:+ start:535 stop:687 length:153 start_codon:yes stop_codon:yes gene_type:complete
MADLESCCSPLLGRGIQDPWQTIRRERTEIDLEMKLNENPPKPDGFNSKK